MNFKKLFPILCTYIVCFTIVSLWNVKRAEASYLRNGEIFNIGWIFSMPYDIGNTLRAPLAGPLSIILTASLSLIMFFGLVASPVYYLLGTPKRKYHVEDAIRTQPLFLPSPSKKDTKKGRSFAHPFDFLWYNETVEEPKLDESKELPDFIESVFYFLPEYDENCRKLMVCHSHGFLSLLPTYFVQLYRVFSSKMVGIPTDYQDAIQVGLEDQGSCSRIFQNCTTDLSSMARRAFFGIILGDPDPYLDPSDYEYSFST